MTVDQAITELENRGYTIEISSDSTSLIYRVTGSDLSVTVPDTGLSGLIDSIDQAAL